MHNSKAQSDEIQFRTIISYIRSKYNVAESVYRSRLNNMFVILPKAQLPDVEKLAKELYMAEQMMVILSEAKELAEDVFRAFRPTFSKDAQPGLRENWNRLYSMKEILGIKEFSDFCRSHTADGVRQLELLHLVNVSGYLHDVVATRGGNDAAQQRINELFPVQQ